MPKVCNVLMMFSLRLLELFMVSNCKPKPALEIFFSKQCISVKVKYFFTQFPSFTFAIVSSDVALNSFKRFTAVFPSAFVRNFSINESMIVLKSGV